jgi:hypothetical protein
MRQGSGRDRRRLIAASVVVLVFLAVLAETAPSLYDVQSKGRGPPLVPYEDSGLVYKIRVLDVFDAYADDESRPTPDKLSSIGLVAVASMSLMTLLLLNAAAAAPRVRRFYAFATAGLALVAADELFALHETLGHNLRFLADLPGVERPDDVVFLSYSIPLAVFAWAFRDVLFAERTAVGLFAVGTVLYGIAVVGDIAGVSIDEPAEVVASGCLAGGLVVITAATLRRELGLGGPPSASFVRGAESRSRALSGVRPGAPR